MLAILSASLSRVKRPVYRRSPGNDIDRRPARVAAPSKQMDVSLAPSVSSGSRPFCAYPGKLDARNRAKSELAPSVSLREQCGAQGQRDCDGCFHGAFVTELLFGPGRRRDPGCRMVRLCFRRSGHDGFTGSVLDSSSPTDYVRQARPSLASTALGL